MSESLIGNHVSVLVGKISYSGFVLEVESGFIYLTLNPSSRRIDAILNLRKIDGIFFNKESNDQLMDDLQRSDDPNELN
jgi:hypothetical protein